MKNLFEVKGYVGKQRPLYEWYRAVAGSWYHWEMRVLNGNAVLHVEGGEVQGGYWGHIQLNDSYDLSLRCIFTTANYDKFPSPEDCANVLEIEWRKMVHQDSKLAFSVKDNKKES